jgi:hypothetical protein
MDAMNAFVLDGSVTMVWGFEDEDDEYAEAILDKMPELQPMSPPSGRSKWRTSCLLANGDTALVRPMQHGS